MTIYTIGYEGKTLDEFCRQLVIRHIDALVDIRELPLSRKKGFSKTPLTAHLQAHDIQYVHVRALGTPRPMRQKLRASGDYETFFREYEQHVQHQQNALRDTMRLAREQRICLMCFEASHTLCHRYQLSLHFIAAQFCVVHLH